MIELVFTGSDDFITENLSRVEKILDKYNLPPLNEDSKKSDPWRNGRAGNKRHYCLHVRILGDFSREFTRAFVHEATDLVGVYAHCPECVKREEHDAWEVESAGNQAFSALEA